MSFFDRQRLRDQRLFTVGGPPTQTQALIAKALEVMGFTVGEHNGSKLVAYRGSKEQWRHDGAHNVRPRLELLPVRAEAEVEEALGGSIVKITLTDAWGGGIRTRSSEELYWPCFLAVLKELSRSAHLTEVFPPAEPRVSSRADSRGSRWSGRTRAFAALALSVVGLTLAVMFLETMLRSLIAILSR